MTLIGTKRSEMSAENSHLKNKKEYDLIDWGCPEPHLLHPIKPTLMSQEEAHELNKQLILNNETLRYVESD